MVGDVLEGRRGGLVRRERRQRGAGCPGAPRAGPCCPGRRCSPGGSAGGLTTASVAAAVVVDEDDPQAVTRTARPQDDGDGGRAGGAGTRSAPVTCSIAVGVMCPVLRWGELTGHGWGGTCAPPGPRPTGRVVVRCDLGAGRPSSRTSPRGCQRGRGRSAAGRKRSPSGNRGVRRRSLWRGRNGLRRRVVPDAPRPDQDAVDCSSWTLVAAVCARRSSAARRGSRIGDDGRGAGHRRRHLAPGAGQGRPARLNRRQSATAVTRDVAPLAGACRSPPGPSTTRRARRGPAACAARWAGSSRQAAWASGWRR